MEATEGLPRRQREYLKHQDILRIYLNHTEVVVAQWRIDVKIFFDRIMEVARETFESNASSVMYSHSRISLIESEKLKAVMTVAEEEISYCQYKMDAKEPIYEKISVNLLIRLKTVINGSAEFVRIA